jgi:uncharacterized protein YdeI (YjbR/CyaY-like superfamily)
MTEASERVVPRGVEPQTPPAARSPEVPRLFFDALARDPKARAPFERLAPSCRRNMVGWVCSAKREETRRRRMEEVLGLLERGEKLGLK